MRSRLLKNRRSLAVLAIFLLGLLAGRWGYVSQREAVLGAMIRNAERDAAAFNTREMMQLTGTAADAQQPVYAEVKARLQRLRMTDPAVRFVYIFRRLPKTQTVVFLADSEPEDSAEISHPGDIYPEAARSPGLQSILQNGLPATEGPIADQFGTWVTGYAVVARDTDGAVRDVLGVDMSEQDWSWRLWQAGLKSAVSLWLLFGLPLAGYEIVRRQREQRDAIRNLSEAIEQSHTAVMIIDLNHRIEYANRGFCTQTGYGRRELIGRAWQDFLAETMPVEPAAEMTTVTRLGRNWNGEWQNRRKDGSAYPARGTVTAVRDRHDGISCYVAVYEDLTEVKLNESILRDAKEQAEAGDRAKSHFLATMSHEVRTPLNGIVGFTNLLLETPLNPEQREYMQTIRSSGEALIQLTNDILDFARIESGKLKLDLQPCDPRECVEDALDLMATRASEKKIELLHWVDENLPAIVLTDPGRLRQVLINLVNNAVKFTEIGEVEVTVSARLRSAPEWELTFTVRDTGIGIDTALYDRLFHPFSQLENSDTTRRYGGTGLGLAISSNLVQLMGGKIDLQSEPGVGSTFTFTILAEEVDVSQLPAKAPPPNISGVRLAVADQPGSLRRELCQLGRRWGALVTETTFEDLPASSWDLALIDVDEALAVELAKLPEPRAGLNRDNMLGLVPLGLAPALRAALRPHFRVLINKPVHHQALHALLAAPVARRASTAPFAPGNTFDLGVLLVEDNPVNQRLMQKVLAKLGCQWTVAENGRIALEELARTAFDVVLMDLHMPEMDGLTAITRIREGKAGEAMRGVWIAALTADARADQRERVMEAGANDYLIKPVRLNDLDKMLKRFVASRGEGPPEAYPAD